MRTFDINGALSKAALAVSMAITAASSPASAQRINGAGATFPDPIYRKWFAAYSAAHSSVTFNYQAVGSGAGYAQFKAGTVDFGASDAPLTDAEIGAVSGGVIHVPTVAGAIVLSYNIPGVGPGLRLDSQAIVGIYMGKIQMWNDPHLVKLNPNVTLPSSAIKVAHRSDGSGTTYHFTNYLASVSSEWKESVGAGKTVAWPVGLGASGNAGVAGLIKAAPGTIGYVELAYAINNKLPYGPVKNKSGNFVLASTATTTAAAEAAANSMKRDVRVSIVNGSSANAYPISGFTYLLVSPSRMDGAKAKAFVEFLHWALGPGQDMADDLYYAKLPTSAVAMNKTALGRVRVAGK